MIRAERDGAEKEKQEDRAEIRISDCVRVPHRYTAQGH